MAETGNPGITLVTDSGRQGAELVLAATGAPRPVHDLSDVTAPPTLAGTHGRAWLCTPDLAVLGADAERDATICVWCVEAPEANPFFHSFAVFAVHLRPCPRQPDAVLHRKGATHQFWVWVLDPHKGSRQRMIETGMIGQGGAPQVMTPCNFTAQLAHMDDDGARAAVAAVVRDIVEGRLSPDTDHVRAWVGRFGDAAFKPEFRGRYRGDA